MADKVSSEMSSCNLSLCSEEGSPFSEEHTDRNAEDPATL